MNLLKLVWIFWNYLDFLYIWEVFWIFWIFLNYCFIISSCKNMLWWIWTYYGVMIHSCTSCTYLFLFSDYCYFLFLILIRLFLYFYIFILVAFAFVSVALCFGVQLFESFVFENFQLLTGFVLQSSSLRWELSLQGTLMMIALVPLYFNSFRLIGVSICQQILIYLQYLFQSLSHYYLKHKNGILWNNIKSLFQSLKIIHIKCIKKILGVLNGFKYSPSIAMDDVFMDDIFRYLSNIKQKVWMGYCLLSNK